MKPKIGPKGFGCFEKRTPEIVTKSVTFNEKKFALWSFLKVRKKIIDTEVNLEKKEEF